MKQLKNRLNSSQTIIIPVGDLFYSTKINWNKLPSISIALNMLVSTLVNTANFDSSLEFELDPKSYTEKSNFWGQYSFTLFSLLLTFPNT